MMTRWLAIATQRLLLLLLLVLVTFVELLNRALGPGVLGTENIKYKIVRTSETAAYIFGIVF